MTYCPRCKDRITLEHTVRLVRDWPDKPLWCLGCGYRDEPVSDAKLQYHLQSNKVPL